MTTKMVTQTELAERFAAGDSVASLPSASNIDARELPDGTDALVGYGHAIYARRTPDGEVFLYDRWRGYSVTTSCQLTKLRTGFENVLGEDGFTSDADRGRPRVPEVRRL